MLEQPNLDACFRPSDELELNRVPDGAMVYQKSRERVHFLNTTAFVVFELCVAGKRRDEIERFVTEAFGLSEIPRHEIEGCLKSLLDEGLVEAVPCTPSSAVP
jgi:hypothetical protein